MPRQVRIEYEGATYHVMCRGDRREAIFADDEDRRTFLRTLETVLGKTGWRLHAFVLMTNHYHLVLETPQANLVRGMTWFQTTYTMRYNRRHRSSGHVFAGRYKAIVIDPEEPRYLGSLIDYIHLNPVRAGLARMRSKTGLLGYPWSSLPGYARARGRAKWLCVERGLGAFEWSDTARERRAYVERLEARVRAEGAEKCGTLTWDGQSLQSTLWRGWYFGREAFREWLLEKADSVLGARRRGKKNYHGPEVKDHGLGEASRLIAAGLLAAKLTREQLRALPKSDPRKARIAKAVRGQTTVALGWLADQLAMGSAENVSRLTAR